MQIPRLNRYLVHTLSTWRDVCNLQETSQSRQRMHHGNPDEQCREVDILYAVWPPLPQMSSDV
jgi:hypothetical protein